MAEELPAPGTSAEIAGPVQVADALPAQCKICGGVSPLYGVVDFHKSCIEAQGKRLPISGCPIYYQRCQSCGFLFTTAFDAWDFAAFRKFIYNDAYLVVDPDYAELRPAGNAALVASTFAASKSSLRILDYGGGEGLLASRLRGDGFSAATYDPFSSFHELPEEKFDLITSFEVMEHVPAPKDAAAAMVSLLKPQGAILFSTLVQPPAFEQVGLNWWYAGPRNGHVSLYSRQALALLFAPHGMKVASFTDVLHIAYAEIPPWAAHLKWPA